MATHRKSHEGTLKKTLAAGAIAGAAVGFSALVATPTASADTNSDNAGWWIGSGSASNNNTIFGQVGNGNVMNNQLNALSPVIGGNAVQTNATTNTNTQTTTDAQTSALNGGALAIPVSAGANTATALPLGAALAGNLGAGTGGASTANTGGNPATQNPVNVPITTGGNNVLPIVPVLSNLNPGGPGTVTDTASPNNTSGSGAITGPVSSGGVGAAGNPEATNAQVAAAGASSTNTGTASSTGGNTTQHSTTTGGTITNNTTNVNSGHAAGNEANNSTNNNTNTNSGNNSSNSVGNH